MKAKVLKNIDQLKILELINQLSIANQEINFQNEEKQKRADELGIANLELIFQSKEKQARAEELEIANLGLIFQSEEKIKRAKELFIANQEIIFQKKFAAKLSSILPLLLNLGVLACTKHFFDAVSIPDA